MISTIKVATISPPGATVAQRFTSIGGYPVYYVNAQSELLCPDCALKSEREGELMVAGDCNWEDPNLLCEECGERIESAYAEPED